MLFSLDEMNYKSTGVCVGITHIAILLMIVMLAINLPREAESVMMMAQMIDRESVAMTPAVHLSPSKEKRLRKISLFKKVNAVVSVLLKTNKTVP